MDWKAWLQSKTFWGVFIAVFGIVSDPALAGFLPPNVAHIVSILGTALAALGLRDAIAKGPTAPPAAPPTP
jgi:hypothetical protein